MRVFVSGCERCFLSLTAAVPADAGTSDSGPLVFDRQGHFTRIAAVRKDGYVSCDCSNNPQCGPGTESCRHTIENCCDNPEGRWNLCAYTDRWPGVDVAAPFELNVNGEQLIVQNAYNEAPVAAGRPCTSEVAMNGAVVCELDIVTALSDTVVLSWNEGRRGQSTGDNCGTLVVDVFGAWPRPTSRLLSNLATHTHRVCRLSRGPRMRRRLCHASCQRPSGPGVHRLLSEL